MTQGILQEVDWKDVYQSVAQVNPQLAQIINNISLNNHHKLIKATYSFGDLIIKEGRLCLPIEDENLYNQLNYSAIPLSLLLNKSAEVFIENSDSSIPLNMLNVGDFFGTFETVNFMMNKKSSPIWSVSAGARSTFMLPKISDLSGMKRLRANYNISHNIQVINLSDHWDLFRQMTLKPNFTELWKCEVLFFTQQWFSDIKDIAWFKFYQLIWEKTWQQAQYALADFNLRSDWHTCLKMIDSRRLKPTPYVIDTIKHLLTIVIGLAPFLKPANDLEQELPLKELQCAFTDIYLLDNYVPTIMSPSTFKAQQPLSMGYYSLAYPTLMSGAPPVKLLSAFMPDLKMIKLIMSYLCENSDRTSCLHNIFLEYFHASKDKFQDVQLSNDIPLVDPAFAVEQQKYPDRIFCANSPFWRGCIRLLAQEK